LSPSIEKILFVALGSLLSALAYLIKRRIEKKHESDTLDRHLRLLSISKGLAEQQISIEALQALENALLNKSLAQEKHREELQGNLIALTVGGDDAFLSQAGLNMRAKGNVKIAEAKMEQVLNELLFELEGEERELLQKSQKAWEAYCKRESEFAASGYTGGTMYPLAYLSGLEVLVVDRTALLQSHLDQVRSR